MKTNKSPANTTKTAVTKQVALMWDCLGLEAAINLSDIARDRTWALLKGEDPDHSHAWGSLGLWRLRAQANPQRHYEIYIIDVEPDVTVKAICEAFRKCPQQMADRVREIGHKFYSDRSTERAAIV